MIKRCQRDQKWLKNKLKREDLDSKILFIGDSEYDFLAARSINADFIFLYEWTEFSDYISWCEKMNIRYLKGLREVYES